jgi:hypothetical protein|tara:strand:+ start:761 stop:1261 length:501 start_codon:yes stop_codon:yes gene_type:complete
MKNIIKGFKEFLNEDRATKSEYNSGGSISLYHYSRPDSDSLTLDPEHGAQSYSRNDYIVSDVPRVFFYVDPRDKERYFLSSNLFTVDVPANRVYDLTADEENYIDSVRHPTYGLRKGEEWNTLLEKIREDYDGIFYDTGTLRIVTWFHPIEVTRVSPEEQARLEGK